MRFGLTARCTHPNRFTPSCTPKGVMYEKVYRQCTEMDTAERNENNQTRQPRESCSVQLAGFWPAAAAPAYHQRSPTNTKYWRDLLALPYEHIHSGYRTSNARMQTRNTPKECAEATKRLFWIFRVFFSGSAGPLPVWPKLREAAPIQPARYPLVQDSSMCTSSENGPGP